jgi:antitoxin MazE
MIPDEVTALPLYPHLDEIAGTLVTRNLLMLHAEPGAGKTTVRPDLASKLCLIFALNMTIHWLYIGRFAMLAKIQKWGNSQGLRIAKNLLTDVRLEVGDEVDISVREGIMIVAPAKRIRGRQVVRNESYYTSSDLKNIEIMEAVFIHPPVHEPLHPLPGSEGHPIRGVFILQDR